MAVNPQRQEEQERHHQWTREGRIWEVDSRGTSDIVVLSLGSGWKCQIQGSVTLSKSLKLSMSQEEIGGKNGTYPQSGEEEMTYSLLIA